MVRLLAESQCGMQGSKSLSKRKREVDAEEQGEREARQLRREMRMRGHVVRCLQSLPTQQIAPLVSPHWTCMQHISVVHACTPQSVLMAAEDLEVLLSIDAPWASEMAWAEEAVCDDRRRFR